MIYLGIFLCACVATLGQSLQITDILNGNNADSNETTMFTTDALLNNSIGSSFVTALNNKTISAANVLLNSTNRSTTSNSATTPLINALLNNIIPTINNAASNGTITSNVAIPNFSTATHDIRSINKTDINAKNGFNNGLNSTPLLNVLKIFSAFQIVKSIFKVLPLFMWGLLLLELFRKAIFGFFF
ncbi:uncharacterized protein LOC122504300 [Leptopilina heterotoma]|uniref:uncharacterized protein LOC122504300 n=1 Tax=Leptopilina heterotoma TaxID=63436 RepID=UPI001CA9ACCA|nr:uncharacterized protein LOC122504300 [Leptopilina heterotoma]